MVPNVFTIEDKYIKIYTKMCLKINKIFFIRKFSTSCQFLSLPPDV